MSKRVIHTNKAPAAIGAYSQGIVSEGHLFTSGQIGLRRSSLYVWSNWLDP